MYPLWKMSGSSESSVLELAVGGRDGSCFGTCSALFASVVKNGSITLRKLLIDGLGSADLRLRFVLTGNGGGGMTSEVDFFRRRKNEEGFLLSVGGCGVAVMTAAGFDSVFGGCVPADV